MYFCHTENFAYGEINKRNFSNPHPLLGAGISSVASVLVSRDRDLCHVELHLTCLKPTVGCRSWPVASNLYSGQLPVGLYLVRGSLLLVGPLFHFPRCHNGVVSSRNGHVRLPLNNQNRFVVWQIEGFSVFYLQLPANTWWTRPMCR